MSGRFGTTSCVIAKMQDNSGRLVVSEPDSSVHKALESNRGAHNCNFSILKGVVSSKPTFYGRSGYDGRGCIVDCGDASTVSFINVDDLETLMGFFKFNAVLIDCEGRISSIFPLEENDPFLNRQELILMEEDTMEELVDYSHWHDVFAKPGF